MKNNVNERHEPLSQLALPENNTPSPTILSQTVHGTAWWLPTEFCMQLNQTMGNSIRLPPLDGYEE